MTKIETAPFFFLFTVCFVLFLTFFFFFQLLGWTQSSIPSVSSLLFFPHSPFSSFFLLSSSSLLSPFFFFLLPLLSFSLFTSFGRYRTGQKQGVSPLFFPSSLFGVVCWCIGAQMMVDDGGWCKKRFWRCESRWLYLMRLERRWIFQGLSLLLSLHKWWRRWSLYDFTRSGL